MWGFARALALSAVVVGIATQARAQAVGAPDPTSEASMAERRAAVLRNAPSEFGLSCCSILQIPAAACQPFGGITFSASAGGYLYPSAGPSICWAPVELPTGVIVVFIDLYFDDSDVGSDIDAALVLNDGYTGSVSALIQNVTSNSSAGKGYKASSVFSHTINNNPSSGGGQYMVRVSFPSSTGNQGFKGVDLWYYRQVSPAPAVATFPNDVPTNHPFFKFVEALAAAGITAGKGPGSYGVDDPITRGEMAVFLSAALGLFWQY